MESCFILPGTRTRKSKKKPSSDIFDDQNAQTIDECPLPSLPVTPFPHERRKKQCNRSIDGKHPEIGLSFQAQCQRWPGMRQIVYGSIKHFRCDPNAAHGQKQRELRIILSVRGWGKRGAHSEHHNTFARIETGKLRNGAKAASKLANHPHR